jgi:transposase
VCYVAPLGARANEIGPYGSSDVKRNKNDAADAAAICEAVRRPTIRFVGIKSAAQQGQLMQHRTRDLLIRQRTQLSATAIVATVPDSTAFRSGRDFAAWIGLVPRQDSTGGKQKLGPISKQGDRYLRRILVVGAHSVLQRAKQNPVKYPWLTQLLARRPFKVVAIALANKMARAAWALLAHGDTYRAPTLAATAQEAWRSEYTGKNVRSRTARVMKALMRTLETVDRKTRLWVMRRKSA